MKLQKAHRWDIDYQEAVRIQERLAASVSLRGAARRIRTIAGVDVSYSKKSQVLYAAVVVMNAKRLDVETVSTAVCNVSFPYIPGLLSFREAPAILEAAKRLSEAPDILLVDGQGIAHPRRVGLASHLGVLLDCSAIGCAKSRLVGEHVEPGPEKGDWVPLCDGKEVIGAVVRTRARVKPLFISPGHKISLRRSISVVLAACGLYRVPEPIRVAHMRVNELRIAAEQGRS